MKKHIYRVEFLTKKNGEKRWAIDIEADNQKEAKETAKTMWYEANTSHAFDITARVLKVGEELEYNYFTRLYK